MFLGDHPLGIRHLRFGRLKAADDVARNRIVRASGGRNIPVFPDIPGAARARQRRERLEIASSAPAAAKTFPSFPTFPGSPVVGGGVRECREVGNVLGRVRQQSSIFRPRCPSRPAWNPAIRSPRSGSVFSSWLLCRRSVATVFPSPIHAGRPTRRFWKSLPMLWAVGRSRRLPTNSPSASAMASARALSASGSPDVQTS